MIQQGSHYAFTSDPVMQGRRTCMIDGVGSRSVLQQRIHCIRVVAQSRTMKRGVPFGSAYHLRRTRPNSHGVSGEPYHWSQSHRSGENRADTNAKGPIKFFGIGGQWGANSLVFHGVGPAGLRPLGGIAGLRRREQNIADARRAGILETMQTAMRETL
jgi:hypothetical protein